MVSYVVLALAAASSFFGFGILSMGALLVAFLAANASVSGEGVFAVGHRKYIRDTAVWGIGLHIVLIVILSFLLVGHLYASRNASFEDVVGFFISHYVVDHAGEGVIALWLLFRMVRGVIWYQEKRLIGGGNPPVSGLNDASPPLEDACSRSG